MPQTDKRAQRRRINGELLHLAPMRQWDANLIRLLGREGFDNTLRIIEPNPWPHWLPFVIIEPTACEFAANQQAVQQMWEAMRRRSETEVLRRAGAEAESLGNIGPASPAPAGAPVQHQQDGDVQ